MALRERDREAAALRLRLAAARLREPLRDGVGGGAYAHASPAVTSAPLKPPTCTKYVRCVATSDTADAPALAGHALPPALSLPARHPNGRSHDGHPVPTYSTVSLAVRPHVVTVSVPPGSAAAPRNSENTRRLPG